MTPEREKEIRQEAEDYMLANYASAKEEGFADPYYKAGWLDATRQHTSEIDSLREKLKIATEALELISCKPTMKGLLEHVDQKEAEEALAKIRGEK